jgi:type IV pilus assembly protein PilQ
MMFIIVLNGAAQGSSGTPLTERENSRLYDFNFTDTNMDAVFQALAVTSGIDILPAPDVRGSVTIKVTQKTWQEVLDIICKLYGLTWLIEDKYIYVMNTSTFEKDQDREAGRKEKLETLAPLVRKSFQIKHAEADKLLSVLNTMKSNRGKLTSVPRNNAIIVLDTEERISEMEKALAELDVETLQIVITAKLVVIGSETLRELGTNWSTRVGSGSINPPGVPGGSALDSRTQIGATNRPILGEGTDLTASLLDGNLGLTMTHILNDKESELLASPQITTLDHETAEIFMGKQTSVRIVDNQGIAASQLVDAGIRLLVTPHVTGDNRILLELAPQNNSFDDGVGAITISNQEARTKVVVADGETAVIAGLTQNRENNAEIGIPILKDIPLLGHLFKYSRKSVFKQDLIIFVTPRILKNDVYKQMIGEKSNQTPEFSGLIPEAVPVSQGEISPEAKANSAQPVSEAPIVIEGSGVAPIPVAADDDWD